LKVTKELIILMASLSPHLKCQRQEIENGKILCYFADLTCCFYCKKVVSCYTFMRKKGRRGICRIDKRFIQCIKLFELARNEAEKRKDR